MDENTFNALHSLEDSLKGTVSIAEEIIELLPVETALAVRRCIVLHWFDLSIVEALLEDRELTIDEMSDIYQQLTMLPFIDSIHLGLTFKAMTRQQLLNYYSVKQPELLQTSARLAAPIYEAHEEDEKHLVESFFCYIIAGSQEASIALQNALLEQGSHHDWHYFENLFRLQDEAEALPFVEPLPCTEQQLLLRGLIHRMNRQQDAALLAYNQALILNPKSVLGYVNRGITYAEQERFKDALNDYNTALRIDKNATQAYANRGVIYAKQVHHKEALRDFEKAIKADPLNSFALRYQGESLYQLGRYEEALTSYGTMLRLDSEDVDAYVGQGQSYNQLERYEEALASFEEALHFNPGSATAQRGKGYALNELERYVEALVAYDKAIVLDVNSAQGYRGRGKALRGLKRYEEASAAYIRADELDPQYEDGIETRAVTTLQGREHVIGPIRLWERVPRLFYLAPPLVQNKHSISVQSSHVPRRGLRAFTERILTGSVVSILIILCLIAVSFLAFSRTSTGGLGPSNATATAQSSATNVLQGCTTSSTNTSLTLSSSNKPHPCSFSLVIDSQGVLNGSTNAINDVEQQVRSVLLLKGRYVALAIVYGSAPTDSDIPQAQQIAQKIYTILGNNKSGSSFSKASFYDPLVAIINTPNIVNIDFYLFGQINTLKNRLDFNYHRLTLSIKDINALLRGNLQDSDVKQQIKSTAMLQGRSVGFAIVYGGAPTDSDIPQAQQIAQKIYTILGNMSQSGFHAFDRSIFYSPLYLLGAPLDSVTIDIYLFTS